MTVLKSFDLKGNKQSFAGWISNLSPCDTPFVSMIGKESVSQAQYSWQIDGLDKPKYPGYEEGSDIVPESRHATHVTHNFTQTLRKVAQVSDTTASISLYGRDSEMNYQMGKAGKELKRDMEFMCLNNGLGNPGTSTVASKFSGFVGLCAPRGYVDILTGAQTYKEVSVGHPEGPWFRSEDLFDLTYNLYLSGSKANKIMFHPRHATTFSDFIGHHFESNTIFRMFDGVDTRYNAQVTKIRDPLGQNYDLIPNRMMPEDKIYIFNEADWTQMILRQPAVSKLGKQGSAERFLLEAEVGLRHRNAMASGVMSMTPSTIALEFTQKPTKMTAGLGLREQAKVKATTRATGDILVGEGVTWSSNNPLIVDIQGTTTIDTDGTGVSTIELIPNHAGTAIITAKCQDAVASFIVQVGAPDIRLRMANYIIEKRQQDLLIAYVLKSDGQPVANGTTVNFKALPGELVQLQSISADTTDGTAQVEITARDTIGVVQLQANIGASLSNLVKLEIVEKVEQLDFQINRQTIAVGINDTATLTVKVGDKNGAAISGKIVHVDSTNPAVIEIANKEVATTTGVDQVRVTAKATGTTVLVATFENQTLEYTVHVTAPTIVMAQPEDGEVGKVLDLVATVSRSDTTKVQGVQVQFVSAPPFNPAVSESTTGPDGIARAVYTPTGNSDLEITATIGAYVSNAVTVSVNMP